MRFYLVGFIVAATAFAADTTSVPSFSKDIAPIFQAKCQECHRAGTAAPMSLVTYQEARPWAKSIKQRVVSRNMPPWHIDKTVGIQHFANDRSLSDQEIATIAQWVDAGAPMGDPKDMPAPKQWPTEQQWQLASQFGQPDFVVKSDDYTMAAHGQDVWWKPVSPIPVTEARWVRAVEIRPSTVAGRKITHHALAQLEQEEPGAPNSDPASAGLLMEWAIGKQYDIYRPDAGKLILPGSQIRWEIHMHAAGEPIRDHVELGVYLYPKGFVPPHRTRLMALYAMSPPNSLDIRPNSITQIQAFHVLKTAARLENFQPHMHLRGKAMSMEAILPDGTVRMLSYVDKFDFNWMNNYIYADDAAPVLPKGTVLRITASYDNTAANPNNPDPNQWVGYGDRTVDEMGHAWVNVTSLSDEEYAKYVTDHAPPKTGLTGGR